MMQHGYSLIKTNWIDVLWAWWYKRTLKPQVSMSVTGVSGPVLKVLYRFEPQQDFEEGESQYLKGYTYTCHKGNKRLSRLVRRWYKSGLIAIEQPEEA